jgi:regulator of sirC expression with transglutaminase-like and TPR domain
MDTYIKLYPKDSSGYWQRGIIYHNLKEYSKAIADYTKVLENAKGSRKTFIITGQFVMSYLEN